MINLVIVICICIISIVMIAFAFSRSQSLQRFGIMEFLLVSAVVVSAFWGYLQARQIIAEQIIVVPIFQNKIRFFVLV